MPIATPQPAVAPAPASVTEEAVHPDSQPRSRSNRGRVAAPQSLWVLGDQAVVSLANFATMAVVGRVCGDAELGRFGLGFLMTMFGFALAKALIWTPYTTHSPAMDEPRRAAFAGSVTVHLLLLCSGITLLAGLVGIVLQSTGATPSLVTLAWVVAICTPPILLREHVRRLLLARLAVTKVLLFDLGATAIQCLVLVLLYQSGALTGGTALAALAATGIAGVVWLVAKPGRLVVRRTAILRDWLANWPLVKWIAGGAAAVQLGNQLSWSALTALRGLVAAGELTQGYNVIRIVNPVLLGVSNYFGPASANIFTQKGLIGLWRQAIRGTLVLLAFALLASAVLITIGPQIAELVFGKNVSGVGRLLIASIALGVFSEAVHVPIEFASLARSRGRLLFFTALLRLALSAAIGLPLIWLYGPVGVGLGMLVGNLASLTIQWIALAKEVRHA